MQLYAIKASGLHGFAGRNGEAVNNAGQLVLMQCSWLGCGHEMAFTGLVIEHIGLGLGGNGRRRNGWLIAGLQRCVRDTAHMPELGNDAPALGMHGIGHLLPGLQLVFAVQTGDIGIALSLGTDGGSFADQQASGGTLRVVGFHQGCRHCTGRAVAR